MSKILLFSLCFISIATMAFGSGFGVFTQGASGLGQANAVVAHSTGPSSLYFNPALLNDVHGRQVEIGTTAIYTEREVKLDSTGQTEAADDGLNTPSTLYYTHEANEKITSGIGIFFPFGLSSEWDDDYEGRYIGTYGEMFSMNINPAISWRVNDKLSLAVGLDLIYVDTDLRTMINQSVAGGLLPPTLGGPLSRPFPDVEQRFTGDGWGAGFNLGVLYKVTERVSIGAAYRSEVDVNIDAGDVTFRNVDPALALLFRNGKGDTDMILPAQFTAGIATQVTDKLLVEIGLRWEDWASTTEFKVDLQNPLLGQSSQVIPRNWNSTWAYNIGGQYQLTESVALNAGYLYGQTPVPNATFEPIIADTDVHLLTAGTDLKFAQWTLSGAFGYEYHKARDKNNAIGDPLASQVAGIPVNTANGEYDTDVYLFAISLGYSF